MPSQPYIVHPTDLQYVPTIMRAPSPSSTIGTDYGPDETTSVDSELSEHDFVRKCEEMVGINRPRPEEDEANRDPLILPRPLSRHKLTAAEEKQCTEMFEQVMNNLRAAVKKLEEDELFDQTAVKSADAVLDDPVPSSDDVDTIMQSLMGLTASANTNDATANATAQFTSRSETVTPQWGGIPQSTPDPFGWTSRA
ncbi:hypothetical protein BD309DRAFT_1005126 [Dichomitus squalens]|uniref:Uncharacterized protein n=1 Tax=Dichomitus squalens TaxID=114155 RepID=A0A4Q9PXC7_9APHY|nr:hypothetical protein BD311DRAFT_795200 [Dichomitus squalens]TBU36932.1 hypothetical protein BD309DRAFT_1005126 [Dichomitus squalens]TBU59180.1 hypothetical protein BD310DRAFT_958367 [Dichomitus squalens]